jgi:hypothetical protein
VKVDRISKSVKGIVFAVILAASLFALSTPASADDGAGITWDTIVPELPLGITWEE